MSPNPGLPKVDAETAASVAEKASGLEDLRLENFTIATVGYTELNAVTVGVHRLEGTARGRDEHRAWSAILKVLRRPRGGADPLGPVPDGWGEDLSHYNYWRREALAYASGAMADLPGGLDAPRCFGVDERPRAEEMWVWLEDVTDHHPPPWSLDRYREVARVLGRFNGAYEAGTPLPSGTWPSRRWLTSWMEDDRMDPSTVRTDASIFRRHFSAEIGERLTRLWGRRFELCERVSQLASVFSHLDAFPDNLLDVRAEGEPDRLVAIDWAFCGLAAPGEEVVQLAAPSAILLGLEASEVVEIAEAATTAYLEGMEDAGARPDARRVRFAFAAASALRWSFPLYRLAGLAPIDEGARGMVEATSSRPLEPALAHLGEVQGMLLDLADEAEELSRNLFD